MRLFHVTSLVYEHGKQLSSLDESDFYRRNRKKPNVLKAEQFLEVQRPPNAPRRRNAYFAFESTSACAHFWLSEVHHQVHGYYQKDPHYYLVEMLSPAKCPMVLVDHAVKCIHHPALLKRVVSEYWVPRHEWACWEYLDVMMTIVEETSSPSETDALDWRLNVKNDLSLSGQLWPIPNQP